MDMRAELRRYLAGAETQEFEWGAFDCFTFTSDWVALVSCIESPANEYRGRYKTARGALVHIRRRGGQGVEDIPSLVYPADEIPHAYASAGDIVLVTDDAEGPALGLCTGANGAFLSPQGNGLQYIKHKDLERAWRIKCRE